MTARRWGLFGAVSRDFLTFGGRVLVHDNPAELEFLVRGARVREVPPSIPAELCLPLREHPRMAAVQFPLNRRAFRGQ